jgi:cation diffusion facilitator CzcD-associated flavoprotein CzcO
MDSNGSAQGHVGTAIVGAGFSGIGVAIRLMEAGVHDFAILERANELGGTWRDNTYPGCQCDVPSHLYSYSFAPNPDWSRTYSPQPEIWDYMRRVAHDRGVLPYIRFGHDVTAAEWDDGARRWSLETTAGPLTAQVLVVGAGPLTEPFIPGIPGLDSFEGAVFHSARWDHEHDLDGERVAVIGTGCTAVQIVPKIQPRVGRLHVFQRTPPWIIPHSDRRITDFERRLYRRVPLLQRLVRGGVYLSREWLALAMVHEPRVLKGLEAVARRHLRKHVADPELRRELTPRYRIGCKRIIPSNDYYPAVTRPNAEVVTDPIEEVRPHAIVTADGRERELDTIVLATGFHVTDFPTAHIVHGRDGQTLGGAWNPTAEAYLGTTVAGFPNMFLLVGPNTGLGHNSLLYMIESQIAYVVDAVRAMARHGLDSVEVRPEVQDTYNRELQARMEGSVWVSGGCNSYYLDASGKNPTIWPGFTFRFRQRTARFRPEDYVVTPTSSPERLAAAA